MTSMETKTTKKKLIKPLSEKVTAERKIPYNIKEQEDNKWLTPEDKMDIQAYSLSHSKERTEEFISRIIDTNKAIDFECQALRQKWSDTQKRDAWAGVLKKIEPEVRNYYAEKRKKVPKKKLSGFFIGSAEMKEKNERVEKEHENEVWEELIQKKIEQCLKHEQMRFLRFMKSDDHNGIPYVGIELGIEISAFLGDKLLTKELRSEYADRCKQKA